MRVRKREYEQAVKLLAGRMESAEVLFLLEGAREQGLDIVETLQKAQERERKREVICGVTSRIKEPESIARKLEKKELDISLENALYELNDLVGIRITCPYLEDVRTIGDLLKNNPNIHFCKEKDYIEHPKSSGYRSLHLIVEVPVMLDHEEHWITVEIQIRTRAMDLWARVDHRLVYKRDLKAALGVVRDLTDYVRYFYRGNYIR